MAEVLGSAEIDVLFRTREAQLRNEVDGAADRVGRQQTRRPIDVPVTANTAGLVGSLGTLRTAVRGLVALEGIQVGVRAIGALTTAASRLEEQQNAVNVTFESGTKIVEDYAKTAVQTAGISETAALRESAAFGGLFTNLGLTNEAAATLSVGAVQLAGDLASIRDLRVEDALQKIQAGLVGEIEPLRRVGVVLNDVTIREKAVAMGLAETTTNVSEQARVLARYQFILENLDEAQGDFVRTNDSQANAQRQLTAATANLSSTLGSVLTPTVAEAVGAIAGLVGGLDSLLERMGTGGLATVVGHAVKALNPLIGLLAEINKWLPDTAEATEIYDATQNALDESTKNLTDSLFGETEAMKAIRDGTADLVELELNRLEAQFAVERSALSMADADLRVIEAQEELNDTLLRGGEYTEKLTAAQRKAADAEDALGDARRRSTRAEEERLDAVAAVAEAEFRFGRQSREANEARQDLADKAYDAGEAIEDVANAELDAADAQRDLTEAQQAGGRTSRDAAEAQRKLDRAYLDQRESALRAAEANVRVADAEAAVNGQTLTANERLGIFRTRLGEIEQAAAEGSPLRTALAGVRADLEAITGAVNFLSGIEWNVPQTLAQLQPPGTVTPGQLAPGAITGGGLSPGAAGVNSLQSSGPTVAIENLNVNNNVDADQLPYRIAWEAGGVK